MLHHSERPRKRRLVLRKVAVHIHVAAEPHLILDVPARLDHWEQWPGARAPIAPDMLFYHVRVPLCQSAPAVGLPRQRLEHETPAVPDADVVRRADKLMYENKWKIKSERAKKGIVPDVRG